MAQVVTNRKLKDVVAYAECGHPSPCGCDVADCCLYCPLPDCRYGRSGGGGVLRTYRRDARDRRVAASRKEGLTVAEIARREGVTADTVRRAVRRARG